MSTVYNDRSNEDDDVQHRHQLEHAQQNALNQLQGIVQNQQTLHRALAERRAMEVRLQPIRGDDVREMGRRNQQRLDGNRRVNGTLSVIRCFIIVLLAVTALMYYSGGANRGDDVHDKSTHVNAPDLYTNTDSKRNAAKRLWVESAAVLDSSGNPIAQNTHGEGWEAVVSKLPNGKHGTKAASTTKTASTQPLSAPTSTSTGLQKLLLNIRDHVFLQYQVALEVLQHEPYSLSLSPHMTDNFSAATSKSKRSIFNVWNSNHMVNITTIHKPTMLDTHGRFNDYNNSVVLSSFIGHIDSIMEYCDTIFGSDNKNDRGSFLDKLIASTPRLIMIANAFILLTYLLHGAVADFFLGPVHSEARRRAATEGEGGEFEIDELVERHRSGAALAGRRGGRERLLGYLFFKVLLIASVVMPDVLDLLVLLLWFSILSFLRSLSHVAVQSINYTAHSGQPPRSGALSLLLLVLFCDGLASRGCAMLFYDSWEILLLLNCDCFLLGMDTIIHVIRHMIGTLEEKHRKRICELEEYIVTIHDDIRRQVELDDAAAVQVLEEESRRVDREVEIGEADHAKQTAILVKTVFILELFGSFAKAAHYINIWMMHGATFGLVDAILFLHIQSNLSAVGRKFAERRNLNRILREIDETFPDATDLDIRKASSCGDVCCICLVTMTTGSVKKVGCGHLFHKNCLREVVERARSLQASKCPLCRASLVDGSHTRQPNVTRDINNLNPQQQQQQLDVTAQLPTQPINNQQANQNLNEQSLFRFSTEGILPSWMPVPAFAFEVVRRETPALVEQNNGNDAGFWLRFFRRGGEVDNINNNGNAGNNPGEGHAAQEQQSFWRRMFILAGAIPMSPEEEAVALEQLTDMFPQYDRADLSRELRARGSAEAVVESVFLGFFSGTPRGGVTD